MADCVSVWTIAWGIFLGFLFFSLFLFLLMVIMGIVFGPKAVSVVKTAADGIGPFHVSFPRYTSRF